MSVVADFKEFEAPKRKKTTPLKSVKLKASVPNPSLASNIFTRSVTASTGAGGHKAPLSAVLIGTKSSGGVPVSVSQPKGSHTTQLSVPTGEVSSIEGPGLNIQTNDVQIVGGGSQRLSVVPYRKQLFVSRLTPETTSVDALEFIHQEFPSQNITVEEFKCPYVRRISSFKISAPPKVLNSKSFYVTCSYIPSASDLTIYEQHLSAIKTVLSHLSERDLLIVLGNFNLSDISWSSSTDSLISTPLSVIDGL